MVVFSMYPADTVDKYIANLKGNEVVSAATPPARIDVAFSSIQQGKNIGILGSDPSLFPVQRLDVVKDLPPMFILHRKVKSAAPYQSSEAFVKKSMVTHLDVKVLHTVVPGEEHGIDATASVDTAWLKEGLDFIAPKWLGTKTS
jgi:hypothetical protein